MSTVIKDLGAVSAYAYAVEKGYTGTEAEFAELMADYAEVGQRAEDAAESALNSKTAAQTAATTATNKASEATTAAQTATTKAGEAQTSAQTASSKASEASQSASQASGYAQTAETAKTDAQTAKTQADTARDEAVTAKTAAETAQGKAEDAQAAAESVAESIPSDYSQLSEDVSDLKEGLNDKAPLKYITDIADITLNFTQITKDSENVTAEAGKKITNAGITTNSNFSYIAYEVTEDGFYYCTTAQSDSITNIFSGTPLGASTFVKGISKFQGFPTQDNPWEVKTGQIVTVSSKTTAMSQNIFLSSIGDATIPEIPVIQEDIKILEQGHCPITEIAPFRIGRYSQSDNSIHSSTTIVCNTTPIQIDYDAVLIADLGYAMDIKLSSDGSTYTWNQHECAFFVPKNSYIKMNVYNIGGVIITDPAETASHVKVINTSIPTSDYSRYHDSFFGIEMYNTVGFCGDSYTARRSTYNNNWTTILAQTKGFTPTLYAHSGYSTKPWIDNVLATLLADTPLDLYWLGLGINDASRILSSETYTVGSEVDLTGSYADYPDTFWGNYGKIIESIQAHAPNAHMVIATVIYHDMYTAQINNGSTNIPPINEAIRGIAEHYNIPVIELADDIFYRSPEYQDNMQATAYTHPDPILFPGMANANARLFAKAVADNPAYFKTSTSST